MKSDLNRQITKLKTQARFAKVELKLDIVDDVVMIYPKHRDDVAASIGYLSAGETAIIAYVIDLKRLDYARTEGFSEEQLRELNDKLNIFKEVRPDAVINHLV